MMIRNQVKVRGLEFCECMATLTFGLMSSGKLEDKILKEVKKAAKRLKAKGLGCIEDFETELDAYEPAVQGPSITVDIRGKYRKSTREVVALDDDRKQEVRHPQDVEPYGEVAISLDKKLNSRLSDPPAGPPDVSILHFPVPLHHQEAKDSARSVERPLAEIPHLSRQFPLAVDLIRDHCEKRAGKNKRSSSAANDNIK